MRYLSIYICINILLSGCINQSSEVKTQSTLAPLVQVTVSNYTANVLTSTITAPILSTTTTLEPYCLPCEVCDCVQKKDLKKVINLKPSGSQADCYQKGFFDFKREAIKILEIPGAPKYSEAPAYKPMFTCPALNSSLVYFKEYHNDFYRYINLSKQHYKLLNESGDYYIIQKDP
jgi:hypothetical protein